MKAKLIREYFNETQDCPHCKRTNQFMGRVCFNRCNKEDKLLFRLEKELEELERLAAIGLEKENTDSKIRKFMDMEEV